MPGGRRSTSGLASQGGKRPGRQALLTVYPLSFQEFLRFRDYDFSRAEDYRFVSAAEEYLETGGYPERVLQPSDVYLAQLLQDIAACRKVTVVTRDAAGEVEVGRTGVTAVPLWRYLLRE
jgi:hypothetical protein